MTHMLAFYSRNLNWLMHILNKIKIFSKKVENFSGKEKNKKSLKHIVTLKKHFYKSLEFGL